MKIVFALLLSSTTLFGQTKKWDDKKLNTAGTAGYLTREEKEMIYEINRLRSDPSRYAELFIKGRYLESREYDTATSFAKKYAVTTVYKEEGPQRDTVLQNSAAETMKALQTLYDTLRKMKPLSILRPDAGIYKACLHHVKDQKPTGEVDHRGTDGSWPWDRITRYSPQMKFGNENIACGPDDVREIVLQLLIDSGIEGYGHRYNLLNPAWTHVACHKVGKLTQACQYWIQNFGVQKGR